MLRSVVSSRWGGSSAARRWCSISGGMIASDTPGGRPDLADLGIRVGKEAALANTAIYTLFIDASFIDRFSAQTRKGDKSLGQLEPRQLAARTLARTVHRRGGRRAVQRPGRQRRVGAGADQPRAVVLLPARRRARRRRSRRAHARDHASRRRSPNVTVRGRRWVMVPKRGTDRPRPPQQRRPRRRRHQPAGAETPQPTPTPPVRRLSPAGVQTLADAYDRGNYDAVDRALTQSKNLANIIRAFRLGGQPVAERSETHGGVRARDGARRAAQRQRATPRDEGGRLLAEYHARVRQPAGADEFECWWFFTEALGARRAVHAREARCSSSRARCSAAPTTPRLHLAYAFVSEQQWLRGGMTPEQEARRRRPLRSGDEVPGDRASRRGFAPRAVSTRSATSTARSRS